MPKAVAMAVSTVMTTFRILLHTDLFSFSIFIVDVVLNKLSSRRPFPPNVIQTTEGRKNLECIHVYASTSALQILRFAQDDKGGIPFWMTKEDEYRLMITDRIKNPRHLRHLRMKNYASSSSSTSSSSFGYLISTFVKFKLAMALASTLPGRKLMRFFLMSDGV